MNDKELFDHVLGKINTRDSTNKTYGISIHTSIYVFLGYIWQVFNWKLGSIVYLLTVFLSFALYTIIYSEEYSSENFNLKTSTNWEPDDIWYDSREFFIFGLLIFIKLAKGHISLVGHNFPLQEFWYMPLETLFFLLSFFNIVSHWNFE